MTPSVYHCNSMKSVYHLSQRMGLLTDVEEISGRDKRGDMYGLGGHFSQREYLLWHGRCISPMKYIIPLEIDSSHMGIYMSKLEYLYPTVYPFLWNSDAP